MSIEIPEKFIPMLGAEMKMDVHWIDVKLKNGNVYKNLVVRGGRYITGSSSGQNGEGYIPFVSEDILKLRRHSILPYWG